MKIAISLITVMLVPFSALAADNPEPQELADRWSLAYNAHDAAKLSELYDPAAILMLHGARTIRSRPAIEEYWSEDLGEGDPITTLEVTHSVNGIDMMLVHGNYQVIERTDGTLLGQGRYAHIWLRDADGNWMLDRDLWNEPFEAFER